VAETHTTFGVTVEMARQATVAHWSYGASSSLDEAAVTAMMGRAAASVCAVLIRQGIDPASITYAAYPNGYLLAQEAVLTQLAWRIFQATAPGEAELIREARLAARQALDELQANPGLLGQVAVDSDASPKVQGASQTAPNLYSAQEDYVRRFSGKTRW
jgi:hypothetical protein